MKGDIDINYLMHFLNFFDLNKHITGTTRGKLTRQSSNKIGIFYPPLETQKEIVAVLEKAEMLKEWREEADKLTEEYLKSVFLEMFGDPTSSKRFEVQKISDLTSFVSYGFTRPMPHFDRGIPIITSKNVSAGHIDFDDVDYTDKESFYELSKKDCPIKNDILYTKDGRIGEAALVKTEEKICISQAVAILRPLAKK